MNVIKLAVCILIVSSVNSFAQETILLGNGEWAPLLGKNLTHYGLASRIVTEAFSYEGITTEYKWYGNSWKRCYKDAVAGKTSGSLCWIKSPEREKEMYFSNTIIPVKQNVFFYLKKNNFDWNSIDDLKGLRIGGTLGYSYGSDIENAEKSGLLSIDRVSSEPLNLKKLLKERTDLFLGMKDIVLELKNKLPPEDAAQITWHPKPVTEMIYCLILSRKDPKNILFMEKFNQGLKKLKESGKWDQYIEDSKNGKYK